MSRKSRIYSKSQMYHVIMRGNNKQVLFYNDDDRLYLLSHIKKYSNQLNIEIYSYCLMSNHIHMLIGNATPKISLFIQKLATSYAMYFNRKYERSGHLFQGRFKSEPVENDEYFKTVTRYILQNPTKANICSFRKYRWNSYIETVINDSPDIINTNNLYKLFEGKQNYINFINITNTDHCMEYENIYKLSDLHCIKIIKQLFNIVPTELQHHTNKTKLISEIRKMKSLGMNPTQIARISGISRKIICSA